MPSKDPNYQTRYYREHRDKKLEYMRGYRDRQNELRRIRRKENPEKVRAKEREDKRKQRQRRRERKEQFYNSGENLKFRGHDGVCSYCGFHGLVIQRFKEREGVVYLCEKCLKGHVGRIEEGS